MFGHSAYAEAPFSARDDRVTPITTAFAGQATVTQQRLQSQIRIRSAFAGAATVVSSAGRRAVVLSAFTGQATFSPSARRIGAAVSFAFGSATMVANGRRVRGVQSAFVGRATMGAYAQSAFEDLIENPNRRLVYTIEISPWLVLPYDEAA